LTVGKAQVAVKTDNTDFIRGLGTGACRKGILDFKGLPDVTAVGIDQVTTNGGIDVRRVPAQGVTVDGHVGRWWGCDHHRKWLEGRGGAEGAGFVDGVQAQEGIDISINELIAPGRTPGNIGQGTAAGIKAAVFAKKRAQVVGA